MITAAEPLSAASPFVAYSYSYPHKSAYRHFASKIPLEDVWRDEQRSSLFLYLHVPFCEYRCGFCNLFTLANADHDLPTKYLHQLRREAQATRSALPDARFTRIAMGGGTPTFLEDCALAELFDIAESLMGAHPQSVPVSCEASPATLKLGKARLLRERGVDRLSLGVQTFDDSESRRLGRPQCANEVREAIAVARHAGFPALNLDLIYGVPHQSVDSWTRSVAEALRFQPEEIYLYPLYVREFTGLGKTAVTPSDNRLEAYRIGREMLTGAGYEQVSLRMFRRMAGESEHSPVYCCQSDGMVGLGCGARSYTRELHYSTEFAVGRSGVSSILAEYLGRNSDTFRYASYGYRLDGEDQRRRYIILSLLQTKGLLFDEYFARFASNVLDDLPELCQLAERELAIFTHDRICLTPLGIEKSDAIGPWLYSKRALRLMEESECR